MHSTTISCARHARIYRRWPGRAKAFERMSKPSWSWQVLQEGRYKGPEELSTVFKDAGVDLRKPIVASCGTGVTASVLALALHQIAPAAQVKPSDPHSRGMQKGCSHVHGTGSA